MARSKEGGRYIIFDGTYVYTNIQTNLKNKGLYLPEVDTVVTTLDEALAERENLAKTFPENPENTSKLVNPIIAQVEQMKNARMAELDVLIEKLRDEYHKLTASVDQIQSTPVAQPDSIINNYEPPVESFALQLFQVAHVGEWVFVSFLSDRQAAIRRIANLEKTDPTGKIENAKNLKLEECCNAVLKIFATDSKYVGKALFLFRAGQLFGENARNASEEFRWVYDLLLDHPSRIAVAVVDWSCATAREDLENPTLPLVLDSTKVVYEPSTQPAKPSLPSSHPYILSSDFKWILSNISSSYSTFHSSPSKLPSVHKLCFFSPQTFKKPTRELAAHSLQLTHVGSPPQSSIFLVRGVPCSVLFYWEPKSYADNTNVEAALRKFIATNCPTTQQLIDLLLGTEKKGFKILKAKIQQHQIWEHAACAVIFENSRQFVVLAATPTKDNVKLYGFTSLQQQTSLQPNQSPSQTQPSQTQLSQTQTPQTQPSQTQPSQTQPSQTQPSQDTKQILPRQHIQPTPPSNSLPTSSPTPPTVPEPPNSPAATHPPTADPSPPKNQDSQEQNKRQFIEIEESKPQQQYLEGRVHKREFTISPSLSFLYLVLGNHLFWDTYHHLGLPLLPFPPSPPSSPLANELFQGPIPTSSYRNTKDKIERLWIDGNCEKVMGHIAHKEEKGGGEGKRGGVDCSVIFDPSGFDEGKLEDVLQSMSID